MARSTRVQHTAMAPVVLRISPLLPSPPLLSSPGLLLQWSNAETAELLWTLLEVESTKYWYLAHSKQKPLTGCHLFFFHLYAGHTAACSLVLTYTKASLHHFSTKVKWWHLSLTEDAPVQCLQSSDYSVSPWGWSQTSTCCSFAGGCWMKVLAEAPSKSLEIKSDQWKKEAKESKQI